MTRITICLVLLLQACASHAVRCDAHLQPINPPADKESATLKPASGARTSP